MELIQVKEGGGSFSVTRPTTTRELVERGQLEPDTVVYDADTKEAVSPDTVLDPGREFGNTVQAQYG